MKTKSFILKVIAMFVIGMVGGIFANQIFWPYIIERPLMHQYNISERPVYVTESKEIIVKENDSLVESIDKVKKIVVGVRTKTATGRILEGSGFVVSSDGLVITLAELVPLGGDPSFYINGEVVSFQILKRDLTKNLALIKVDSNGLATAGFADLKNISLGERIFTLGFDKDSGYLAEEGVIKNIGNDFIGTNISEDGFLGGPIFNIKREIIGIGVNSLEKNLSILPVSLIKEFTGF